VDNPFSRFIQHSKYAVALMPDAKGLLADSHPSLVGIFWGDVSLPGPATRDIVELADAYIFVGASFTDYNTCGNTIKITKSKLIQANPHEVTIGEQVYPNIVMKDFIELLQQEIRPNEKALVDYMQAASSSGPSVFLKNFKKTAQEGPSGAVTNQYFLSRVQSMIIDDKTIESLPKTIIVETGDAWFGGMKLQLRENDLFEIQMQYGSIGWAVGATFGLAMASSGPQISSSLYKRDLSKQERRIVAIIGDGSFQLTAQEALTRICI
jgi:pyruvate decarboxylase